MKTHDIRKAQEIETYGYLPPQSVDLEECVLGAILLESDAITRVAEIIKTPECFYKYYHQLIYTAMIELWAENEPIDLGMVVERLKKNGALDAVGGPYYIAQLTNKVGSSAHIESHARIINQKWVQRELIGGSTDVIKTAYSDECDPFDLIDKVLSKYQDLLQSIRSAAHQSWTASVDEFTQNIEEASKRTGDEKYVIGRPTGLYSLDRLIMGYCDTHLIIIAGRPSEGKTSMMLQGVRESARRGIPVGLFSLEMATHELILKIISMESGLDLTRLRQGTLSGAEWEVYRNVAELVKTWPIYCCDQAGITINEIKAISKAWQLKYGVRAIYLDYIQLVTVSESNKAGNREQEISVISRTLKVLAKEINAPVIALSQMSREIEKRPKNDKRPRNSDLRESGSIEQDANEIVFVFRPELHGIDRYEDGSPTKDMTEMIVTKSRLGSTGIRKAKFEGRFSRFVDIDSDYVNSYSKESDDKDLPF